MNIELIQLINIVLYRFERSIENATESYLNFRPGNDARTPSEILNHLSDVSSYGLAIMSAPKQSNSENSVFEKINANFIAMKSYLVNNNLNEETVKKLINGPLSDSLTHIGQLALLRRLEGNPIEWENYTNANS